MVVHVRQSRRIGCATQNGFTYLGVLIAVAIMSVGLLAISEVWTTSARRQKLAELDWIGTQFIAAIGAYYEATPGVVVKTYPTTLEELLEDRRYLAKRRHLRQLYLNPFTGKADWQIIKSADGGIQGVRVKVQADDVPTVREYVYRRGARPSVLIGSVGCGWVLGLRVVSERFPNGNWSAANTGSAVTTRRRPPAGRKKRASLALRAGWSGVCE
jgi:type II secretory pathway pseudopilin PulG